MKTSNKIILAISFLFLFFCSPTWAYFETEITTDVYENDDFILMEEEKGQNRFYAMVEGDGFYKYIQYNGYFNQVFNITNIFDVNGLNKKVSAIDVINRRYFFTTTSGNKSFVYVLGLDTGDVISRFQLNYLITVLKFDNVTGYLIGLARNRHGNVKTVRIDTITGELTRLADLRRNFPVELSSIFFKDELQEMWMASAIHNREYIMTVSTLTGRASVKKVLQVLPGGYRIYNFNTMQLNQMLFSLGRKNSIMLGGYNEKLKVAFILHLNIDSENVKNNIEEIHQKLLEMSEGGLKDYQLYMTSGKAFENFTSFSMATSLLSKLKEVYDIDEVETQEFFVGKPYSMLATVEGIEIH